MKASVEHFCLEVVLLQKHQPRLKMMSLNQRLAADRSEGRSSTDTVTAKSDQRLVAFESEQELFDGHSTHTANISIMRFFSLKTHVSTSSLDRGGALATMSEHLRITTVLAHRLGWRTWSRSWIHWRGSRFACWRVFMHFASAAAQLRSCTHSASGTRTGFAKKKKTGTSHTDDRVLGKRSRIVQGR